MTFIAAIDQGTTSTRCILFNRTGDPIAMAQQEHRQIYPQPGWVEHDPMEIWAHALGVLTEALGLAKCGPGDLAGQGGQDRFRRRTGLPLATYFSGPKIVWLLENVPGARQQAEQGELLFGTIDTWLVWNLTGVHVTDVTNAGRTLLMNLATLDWDEDLLREISVPRALLPRIASSSEVYGATREGIPVAGILGDQQAALFGQTCFSPGEAKNTYGTGCFMLINTGEQAVLSINGLLTTPGYQLQMNC